MTKKLRITVEGETYDVTVEVLEDEEGAGAGPALLPPRTNPAASVSLGPPPPAANSLAAAALAVSAAGRGDVVSPLAGTVVKIETSVGKTVAEGQNLITLEAMKMNIAVVAPCAGTVKDVRVEAGVAVQEGQILLTLS